MKKIFLLLLISSIVINKVQTANFKVNLDFGALAVQIDEFDTYPDSELPTIITELAKNITSKNFPIDEQRGYLKEALREKFINLTTGESQRLSPSESKKLSNLVDGIEAPIVDPKAQSAFRQKINGVVVAIKESISDLFSRMGDRFKSWIDVFTAWNKTRKKLKEAHENTLSEVTQRAQSQLSENSSIAINDIIDTPEKNIERISLIVEVIALINRDRGGGSEGDNAYLEVEELVQSYLLGNKEESLDNFKKRAAKEAFNQYKINQKTAKQNSSDDLLLSTLDDQSASKDSPDTLGIENHDTDALARDFVNAKATENAAISGSLTSSPTDNPRITVNQSGASMTSGQNAIKAPSENITPATESDLNQQADRDRIVQEEKAKQENKVTTSTQEKGVEVHAR